MGFILDELKTAKPVTKIIIYTLYRVFVVHNQA